MRGCVDFYPRSPCGERHAEVDFCWITERDFYPRSPCGERLFAAALARETNKFLSTLSLRRATFFRNADQQTVVISIHALLAESDGRMAAIHQAAPISIHALLAESDYLSWAFLTLFKRFLSTLSLRRATSFHAAHFFSFFGGFLSTLSLRRATACHAARCCQRKPFLSTLSLRRATRVCKGNEFQQGHFYPRSPCGERLILPPDETSSIKISIHALLAESDNRYGRPIDVQLVFLSTLSLRRAT